MQKALLALAIMAVSGAAQAETKTCRGKVFLDSVYQVSTGGKNFDYYVQVRNATDKPIHWTLNFKSLPTGVQVLSTVRSGELGPRESVVPAYKFGKGINGNINVNSVTTGYDVAGPMIVLTNCY